MRAVNYSSMNIFNMDQVKQINNIIKENFIEGKDDAAADSHKTSNVFEETFFTVIGAVWAWKHGSDALAVVTPVTTKLCAVKHKA